MGENFRALFVVLVLSVPVFYVSQRAVGPLIGQREFAFFRNCWYAATVAAFLTVNFFIYAAVLSAICVYANMTRFASVGLFLVLLMAVPLVDVEIGGFDIVNRLIDLNDGRVLVVVLLIPLLLAQRGSRNGSVGGFALPDLLVIIYVLLRIILDSRETEITNGIRVATLYVLDALIPYFAFSRAVTSAADVRRTVSAFIIATLPLALVGVFETLKGWHLYSIVAFNWGTGVGYLMREGILRGSATAMGPITLGLILVVSIGCGLAVWHSISSRQYAAATMGLLVMGLLAALSRGPWIGAAVVFVAFHATGPQAAAKLTKYAMVAVAGFFVVLLSPFGQKIVDLLPFVGSVDAENVDYRKSLFDAAMVVVDRNFWFGSVDYRQAPELKAMEELVGMIDLVNQYIKVVLDAGVVGLSIYLGFFGIILLRLWRVVRLQALQGSDMRIYARAMMATLVGILVTIATVGAIDLTSYIVWSFAGLSVAVVRIAYRDRAAAKNAVQLREASV